MTKQLTSDWMNWIQINIDRGCDKDGIFKILLDEGFSHDLIVAHMKYEPLVDPASITNPLAASKAKTARGHGEFSRKIALNRNKIFLPNAQRLAGDLAEFYLLEDFLQADECENLMSLIESRLRPSHIARAGENDNAYRTSSTCDLGNLNDPLVQDIDRRICSMIGIDPSFSEPIQGQHYKLGQQFKPHTDFFEADQIEHYADTRGQRTYTFFIYLNDVEEGGETEFPRLGLTVKPRQGQALIWNNLTPQGLPNHNTIHQAHPVLRGTKSVITKWFRAKGVGPMYTKDTNEFIPNFTKTGFQKSALDAGLFNEILAFYRENREHSRDEAVEGGFLHTNGIWPTASTVVELPERLRTNIHTSLWRELSEWSGVGLLPTYVYGIRTYQCGAILEMHRDRLATHIISAVINVDQEVNKPWPLFIEDNYYRTHKIYLRPGEVVYYEGARLSHGRPEPFDGNRFANIFCHYRPAVRKRSD